jgi:Protein of unknown function (DUF2510)
MAVADVDEYLQRGAAGAAVDLQSFTWRRGIDWALGVGLAGTLGIAAFALALGGLLPAWAFALPLIAPLYLVAWWRAVRMSTGVALLAAGAEQGRLRLRGSLGTGSLLQAVGSGRDAELVIADGWVRLTSTSTEAWPAASVALGARPSYWVAKGVELQTPSGPRWVSAVRPLDPAVYLRTRVDRPVAEAIGRALAVQRAAYPWHVAVPPGWYPDPAGTPQWRWWDGTGWGAFAPESR